MKIILFASPIILFIEVILINWIVDLLRQPSDVAVLVGVVLLCADLVSNYYLIKLIQKQLNKQTK